jgi:4-hydroxy-tetrahydrodipicolinate reductase
MTIRFNVVQVGLGPMGKLIANLLAARENIHLIGIVDIDPELQGKKLKELLPSSTSTTQVSSDLEPILKDVDVVVVATTSSLLQATPTIKSAVQAGCNVISICEELSYPYASYPELSHELDSLAKKYNASILGTGINPGYLMDLLPIVLTAPCQKVDKISVTRMMNSSKRREPFQRKIGTGLSVTEFREKIEKKEITGHVGLTQSIQMIIAALGLKYNEIIEYPPEPMLSEVSFRTSYGAKVEKGQVCGLRSVAKATSGVNDDNLVTLDFIAYSGDHAEYDRVVVTGTPSITQEIKGGVHGDLGTAAMVTNLIPHIYYARAGLHTMKDIPIPCNTQQIWKSN